jgi:Rps23 Pro-64 3,4-dihydroxylase Tpa1-like proline 4-hydroxylase
MKIVWGSSSLEDVNWKKIMWYTYMNNIDKLLIMSSETSHEKFSVSCVRRVPGHFEHSRTATDGGWTDKKMDE